MSNNPDNRPMGEAERHQMDDMISNLNQQIDQTPADAPPPFAPPVPQPAPTPPAPQQPAPAQPPVPPAPQQPAPIPPAPQPVPPAPQPVPTPPAPQPAPIPPAPQPVPTPPQQQPTPQPAPIPPAPQPVPTPPQQQPAPQPAPIPPAPQPAPIPPAPQPAPIPPAPQPAPIPPAPQPAPIPPIPQPAPSVEEYKPAYEQLEQPAAPLQVPPPLQSPIPAPAPAQQPAAPSSVGEPTDILVAIATVDPESETVSHGSKAVSEMRREALSVETSRKEKKEKITMQPLPFNELTRGTPVIATFYSPSGGVGKSSQAMNTAAYIAAIAQKMAEKERKKGNTNVRVPRVVMVDGDIAMGSLGLRLKGDLTPSIHTLQLYLDARQDQGFEGEQRWPQYYENAPRGEKSMRDFVMWPEQLPNLNLLAAPEEPDMFFEFGAQDYRDILRLLSKFYDVIIIDAGTDIMLESQRSWLQNANEVFLVMTPEVDRLYNSAKAARIMAKAAPHPQATGPNPPLQAPLITRERLSVVLTKADADAGFNVKAMVKKLFPWLDKSQMFYISDFSAEMLRANNQSKFLVLRNAEYAKTIGQMAKTLFARHLASMQQHALPAVEAQPAQQNPVQQAPQIPQQQQIPQQMPPYPQQ